MWQAVSAHQYVYVSLHFPGFLAVKVRGLGTKFWPMKCGQNDICHF